MKARETYFSEWLGPIARRPALYFFKICFSRYDSNFMKILITLIILTLPSLIYSEYIEEPETTLRTQAPKTQYFDSKEESHEEDSIVLKEPLFEQEDYSSLLQFKLGLFNPQGITIENERYQYYYSTNALKTFLFEGGWDMTLFKLLGHWGLKTQAGYAFIRAHADEPAIIHQEHQFNYLNIIPAGASLTYGLQLWKRQWIIPYVEGGAHYYFYFQLGKTDAAYTNGGVLHPHWVGGIRVAINNILSTLFSTKLETPYFLEAEYRETLPPLNSSKISFSQKTYFAGISLGI